MGGWFSKWSSTSGKANANAVACSKPVSDPNIIRQFEDQIYGIELTKPAVCTPITQPGIRNLEKLI